MTLQTEYADDPEYLTYSSLTVITKLGKTLAVIVLFRREDDNYPKNSCYAADPFIVIAACCYVVGKAEELPNPAENAVAPIFV